jgi:hypothetical protein
MNAWLSETVFSWLPHLEGWSTKASANLMRPYTHWEHAQKLSNSETNQFIRIDIVTTLKRSVDIRIRNLNDIYQFRNILFLKKTKRIIELLSQLEIIRPMMISKLNRIRNTIEHQDEAPPSHDECMELVDFTWYFLRSTDILIQQIPGTVIFEPGGGIYDSPYWVSFNANTGSDWSVKINGWVENDKISLEEKSNCIIIDLERFDSAEVLLDKNKEWDSYQEEHKNRNPSDIHFNGRFIGPPEMIKVFIINYFRAR